MVYTILPMRKQVTHTKTKKGFPATEWTSSIGLPMFEIEAASPNDAAYKARWILLDSEFVTHTFTMTDGDTAYDSFGNLIR